MSTPKVKDPLTSFRGVMAGGLVLEAIVVALSLLVVSKLGSGFSGIAGWVVLAMVVLLLATCAVLRHDWSRIVVLVLQVLLIACGFLQLTLGVVGVIFLIIWVLMLWMRADVARKYRAGQLPSQQAEQSTERSAEQSSERDG